VRPRFHVPGVDATAARIELPEEEAEHLVRVLRLGVGDEVDVFDGRGGMWRAEIVDAGKRSAAVRTLQPLEPAPELEVSITLVLSVLKGDKLDEVIRDAVMLGVAAIRPVIAERSEISAAAIVKGHRIQRWQRIAVASAKQCGRAVVPTVHDAAALSGYWDGPRAERVMCVEPSAAPTGVISVQLVPRSSAVDVMIGPEGGWSSSEVSTARDSGAILMSLGGRTLRADAVAIVALTALLTTWGELK